MDSAFVSPYSFSPTRTPLPLDPIVWEPEIGAPVHFREDGDLPKLLGYRGSASFAHDLKAPGADERAPSLAGPHRASGRFPDPVRPTRAIGLLAFLPETVAVAEQGAQELGQIQDRSGVDGDLSIRNVHGLVDKPQGRIEILRKMGKLRDTGIRPVSALNMEGGSKPSKDAHR